MEGTIDKQSYSIQTINNCSANEKTLFLVITVNYLIVSVVFVCFCIFSLLNFVSTAGFILRAKYFFCVYNLNFLLFLFLHTKLIFYIQIILSWSIILNIPAIPMKPQSYGQSCLLVMYHDRLASTKPFEYHVHNNDVVCIIHNNDCFHFWFFSIIDLTNMGLLDTVISLSGIISINMMKCYLVLFQTETMGLLSQNRIYALLTGFFST